MAGPCRHRRAQIVKADVNSHQMIVLRDGVQVASYPASYGLDAADAKAYYDTVLYGDPVEVTGSGVPLSQADGDIYDWTFGWEQWQRLSAL